MLSASWPRLAGLCVLLASFALVPGCSSDDDSGGSGSTSGGSSSGGSSGSTTKQVGDDCEKVDDCGSSLNICLKVGGATKGFCTRSCTKSEDCPEQGFECNLSPYTACVPKH